MSTTIFKPFRIASFMLGGLVLAGAMSVLNLIVAVPFAQAACSSPLPTSKGTATMSVDFPAAGSYRVWARMLAPSSAAAGVYFQLPDANVCGAILGRTALPTDQLTWVDYQNGNTAAKLNVTVGAGTHQVVLAGLDDGVEVDKVIFLTDTTCVPTGDGSNCQVNATPAPTATPTPTPTPPTRDTIAPSVPANLRLTGESEMSLALAWTVSTDNVGVTGYNVLRNGAQIGTSATATYVDNGLTPNTAYSYTVEAYDAAGNKSAASAAFVASTKPALDTTPPSAPEGASAAATSPTSVGVSWRAASDNVGVTGYYVLRNGVTLSLVTGLSYTDNTAVAATTYSYVVKARDAAGNVGSGSNVASVTTPNPPDTQAPSAPGGLTATAASARQVNLAWTASTDNVGVAGYRVSRGGQVIGQTTSTSYGDTSVQPSTQYSYTVVAYDAAGKVSANSNTATITTPAVDTVKAGGLNATYFNDLNFNGTRLSRVDKAINFRWNNGAPAQEIGADTFSVRWTGRIHAPSSGKYIFYTRSDDGVRLWVDGKLLVDNWTNHSMTENKASISLIGGQRYDIRMEYYENTGEAISRLLWKGPGISKQVVPSNVLYYQNAIN